MSLEGTIESMNKRIKTTTIIDAICHKQLFGSLPAFSNLDSWTSWLVWLKSIYALPMDDAELAIYQQCTGRTQPPATQPSEIYTICGRRGGKSFISSLTAVFIACFSSFKQYLNADENLRGALPADHASGVYSKRHEQRISNPRSASKH